MYSICCYLLWYILSSWIIKGMKNVDKADKNIISLRHSGWLVVCLKPSSRTALMLRDLDFYITIHETNVFDNYNYQYLLTYLQYAYLYNYCCSSRMIICVLGQNHCQFLLYKVVGCIPKLNMTNKLNQNLVIKIFLIFWCIRKVVKLPRIEFKSPLNTKINDYFMHNMFLHFVSILYESETTPRLYFNFNVYSTSLNYISCLYFYIFCLSVFFSHGDHFVS